MAQPLKTHVKDYLILNLKLYIASNSNMFNMKKTPSYSHWRFENDGELFFAIVINKLIIKAAVLGTW